MFIVDKNAFYHDIRSVKEQDFLSRDFNTSRRPAVTP